MSKVRTLSRYFLKGHPRAGEQTHFVEKFLWSLNVDFSTKEYLHKLIELNADKLASVTLTEEVITNFWLSLSPTPFQKFHTIRKGIHFAAGDYISLRCWSGNPYKSAQIRIWDDVLVKKVWIFNKYAAGFDMPDANATTTISQIAKNDGLETQDFKDWFDENFNGQIICWNSNINY